MTRFKDFSSNELKMIISALQMRSTYYKSTDEFVDLRKELSAEIKTRISLHNFKLPEKV